MMRTLLGIVAFTLTFGLSATLVGVLFGFPKANAHHHTSSAKHDSAHNYAIKKLLRRDVRIGERRKIQLTKLSRDYGDLSSLYQSAEYLDTINKYYIKSSSINDSFLPEDFKYAWREHMNAWKKQITYLNSLRDDSYSNGNESAEKNYTDNSNEINRTWDQVLRIGKRYGVNTDSSFYR